MAERFKLKTVSDPRGRLTVLERLPFAIKRVYYLHGIDPSAMRGGHAHRNLDRVMVAVSGSFTVTIGESIYPMSDPTVGLRINPMEWVEARDFSPDAVCLVLASEEHDEADAIRDYDHFQALWKHQRVGEELTARGDL